MVNMITAGQRVGARIIAGQGGEGTRLGDSLRVTLDKIGGRWLISAFEPI
jgi:hypothetical protein